MLKYLLSAALLVALFSCSKESVAPSDVELDINPKILVTLVQGSAIGQHSTSPHEGCGDINSADRPVSNTWINLFVAGTGKGEEIESIKTDRHGQVLFSQFTPGELYEVSALLDDGTEVSQTVTAPDQGRTYVELRF